MITLHQPYKLDRKVMSEKSGINKNVRIKKTRDIKIANIKFKISIFISILISCFIVFGSIVAKNFTSNILQWSAQERFVFLILSCVLIFPIWFYCSNHLSDDYPESNNDVIKINYLSSNWFKKLFSLLIIILLVVMIFYSIISFCYMNVNWVELPLKERVLFIVFIYPLIFLFSALAHNNKLKFLIRIS